MHLHLAGPRLTRTVRSASCDGTRGGNHAAAHWRPADRYDAAVARTKFGHGRTVHAPGREDLTRDVAGVISGILSTSFAAPRRFGDRLGEFVADFRDMLDERTPTGRLWDWPGDTAIIIATKPR